MIIAVKANFLASIIFRLPLYTVGLFSILANSILAFIKVFNEKIIPSTGK